MSDFDWSTFLPSAGIAIPVRDFGVFAAARKAIKGSALVGAGLPDSGFLIAVMLPVDAAVVAVELPSSSTEIDVGRLGAG